jgi:hypothetical protein
MNLEAIPPMNLLYADNDEAAELSKLYIDVWTSGNRELFRFLRLYFYLLNKRVECAGESYPITDPNIWPYINSIRTAVKSAIYNQNAEKVKCCKEYLITIFSDANTACLSKLNNDYFTLSKKMPYSQICKLKYESNLRIQAEAKTFDFGQQWNDLAFTQACILERAYEVSYIRCFNDELHRENIRNAISIALAVVGTIVTILGTAITLIPMVS